MPNPEELDGSLMFVSLMERDAIIALLEDHIRKRTLKVESLVVGLRFASERMNREVGSMSTQRFWYLLFYF